jgi:hypothetical protein
MSKTFGAEKARSWHKGGRKVQQGWLVSRETEAVEIDVGMSIALSKGLLADRHGPSQREARLSKAALQGKQGLLM